MNLEVGPNTASQMPRVPLGPSQNANSSSVSPLLGIAVQTSVIFIVKLNK